MNTILNKIKASALLLAEGALHITIGAVNVINGILIIIPDAPLQNVSAKLNAWSDFLDEKVRYLKIDKGE